MASRWDLEHLKNENILPLDPSGSPQAGNGKSHVFQGKHREINYEWWIFFIANLVYQSVVLG